MLRSRSIGVVWLAGALFASLLVWQHLIGWPLQQRFLLTMRAKSDVTPGVYKIGLPGGAPASVWDTAFARAQEDGMDLPRYAMLDRLENVDPARGGFFLKGRTVFVAPRQTSAADSANHRFTVALPWIPKFGRELLFSTAFLSLTLLLLWARNATLHRLIAWGRSSVARDRPWVSAALALLAITAAVSLHFRGFSFPFWDGDTQDYLKPALLFSQGGELSVTPDRPLAYPLFAGLLLRMIPDFRAMVAAQGIATLFAGAAIGSVIWLAGVRLFPPGAWRLAARGAGIAAFALFTLNEDIVERESALLPEAWAATYLAVQLILAWRLTSCRLSFRRLLVEYALFCAAGWGLVLTKPNWGLALVLLPLPLLAGVALGSETRGEFWKRTGAGLGILAAVSAGALLAQSACTPLSTSASLDLRSRVLIFWHIPLVRPEIARRLAQEPDGRYAPVLRELAQIMDEELAIAKKEGPGGYPLLGYDGDRILYIGGKKAYLYDALPLDERSALCRELFFSAVRRHPGVYFQKVIRQVCNLGTHPYGPTFIYLPYLDGALDRSVRYLQQPHAFLPVALKGRFEQTLARASQVLRGCWPSVPRLGLSLRINALFELLTLVFREAILIPMAICAAAALTPAWRRRVAWPRLAPVLTVAVWSIGSGVLCGLTCALSQAFEVQRYIDLFFPLTLFAELLWPLIALSVVFAIWRGRKQAREDANAVVTARVALTLTL